MFPFLEFLEEQIPIAIVDVGAASMGAGSDAYAALLTYPSTTVYGFEPNEQAWAARKATASNNQQFLQHFVGDGSERTFYECENPLTSSLYEPNAELLARFQRLDLPVTKKAPVKTTRLDDTGIADVDFLKLDIQGAELDAINGAPSMLASALIVHTEIEFIPMYKGQALFGDIDVALRSHGYMFHNFIGLFSRQFKPMIYNNDLFSSGSQLLYAEAGVYIRDVAVADTLPRTKLLKFATIMHDVYGSVDLVCHLLEIHDRRFSGSLLNRYIARLNNGNLTSPNQSSPPKK